MKTLTRYLALLIMTGLLVNMTDAQIRYGKLGVGAAGSVFLPMSMDIQDADRKPGIGGGLSVVYSPFEYFAVKTLVGIGQVSYDLPVGLTIGSGVTTAKTPSTTTMVTLNGYAIVNLMPNSSFNPFVGAGAGYLYVDARTDKGVPIQLSSPPNRYDFTLLGTAGFDFFPSEFISITASADYGLMQIDGLDGITAAGNKDAYLRAGLEIRYYFFDQAFLTRLLEALKKRYEN